MVFVVDISETLLTNSIGIKLEQFRHKPDTWSVNRLGGKS